MMGKINDDNDNQVIFKTPCFDYLKRLAHWRSFLLLVSLLALTV